MNRFRKRNEGVSPVIATILMVAITVVLAGVLVVYLQTLPSGGGNVETSIGISVEKTSQGNWTVSISQGKVKTVDMNVVIVNPNSGVKTVNTAITTVNWNFVFNQGEAGYIKAGDSILLNQSANVIAGGYKFSLVRIENTIAGPKELP